MLPLIYYALESFILAIPVGLIWKYMLAAKFSLELGYFDWVGIFYIAKLLLNNILGTLQFIDAPENENLNEE